MADYENTADVQNGFECVQDDGWWICTDPDTGRAEIGETRAEAVSLLRGHLAKQAELTPAGIAFVSKAQLREKSAKASFDLDATFQMINEVFQRLAKNNAKSELSASIASTAKGLSEVDGIKEALGFCESEIWAKRAVFDIVQTLGMSSKSTGIYNYFKNLRRHCDEVGSTLATLIQLMENPTVVCLYIDTEEISENIGTLKAMMDRYAGVVVTIEDENQRPYVMAGHTASKGAAVNNPNAWRASLARALDSCIPAAYDPKEGYPRWALISKLMAVAGVEFSSQRVARAINR